MRARLRRALLATGATAVVAAGIIGISRLLRELRYFEVRAVEVSGVHLLAPHEVLGAAAIREGQTVWDDPAEWERALENHPAIASARVSRRFPGTLRIHVEEKRAVAYVDDGSLTPVTGAGERLPIDPIRAPVNLPIARGPEGAEVPLRVLAEAERLARLDPGLLSDVSEIRARDPEGRTLLLRHRKAEVLLPAGAAAARLAELRVVLADLDRRPGPGDAEGVARVDLRFAEQVVVRLPPSVQMP
jgi:cell division septal protein FtsQ